MRRAVGPAARTLADRLRARAGWRGQGGYTLIEVLLVVGVSAIILVPVLAWTVLALRSNPITQDGLVRTADTGLLGAYLPGDVATAGSAADSGDDCVGGGATAGQGGTVRLVLESNRTPAIRTVYVEAPLEYRGDADPVRRSVWRRECASGSGELLDAVQVFEDVREGTTKAICSTEGDDTPCRQVEFRVRPTSDDADVVVRATRRADIDRQPQDLTGNRIPVARITVTSVSGSQPLVASFSAADSYDPDGNIVEFRWVLQNEAGTVLQSLQRADASGPTWQLPSAGQYAVILTVTDDKGAASTTYKHMDVHNRAPSASISATPTAGQAGVTEFAFNGHGSIDPDGSIASYRWTISRGGDEPDLVLEGPDQRVTFPVASVGSMSVSLTVTDQQGASGTAVTSVTVTAGPPGGDPNDPTTTGAPGSPVAVFTAVNDGAPDRWRFDASGSTDDGTIVSYAWDFGLGAGTGTGVAVSRTYANPGDYVVTLRVTDDLGLVGASTQLVNIPGKGTPPGDVRRVGSDVVWSPVPGARGYKVDVEFFTGVVCAIAAPTADVPQGPNPSHPIPSSQCPPGGVTRARVGADVNGEVEWSGWVEVTLPGGG